MNSIAWIIDKIRHLPVFISRQYKRLMFNPHIISKNIERVSFDFFVGDWVGQEWYVPKNEWIEMRFIRDKLVEKGDVVFECGAHHGFSAIMLSNWVGCEGRVIAFEPNPDNINIINRNMSINHINNVDVKHCAIGEAEGKITLTRNSCAEVNSDNNGVEVDVVPIDKYIELQPTLLKIDVEGFEVQVLRGARKILETRPKIAIEIHADFLHKYGSTVEELFSLLNLDRYDCWIQWEDNSIPEIYNGNKAISQRVHLFALPK